MPHYRNYSNDRKIEMPVEVSLTELFANMTGEEAYLSFKDLGGMDAQGQIHEFLSCYAEDYGPSELYRELSHEMDIEALVEDFARADKLPQLAEEVIQNTAPEVVLDMLQLDNDSKLTDILKLIARDETALFHALGTLTSEGKDTLKVIDNLMRLRLIERLAATHDDVPS